MSADFDLAFPATSANLGPAFDAAALALDLPLRVRARAADAFALTAEGRDAAICAAPENHLVVDVYRRTLAEAGGAGPALALHFDNAIPIGKGCGSSAAARLAGVALAAHFGGLGWDAQQIFERAAALEGHPDNAAACWWGGLVVAGAGGLRWLQAPVPARWRLLLALPADALATEKARAVLPASYSRADAVANLQNALLLLGAFVQGREDLLATAFADRWHQPYRAALCPLLPALQPLAGQAGILGCALSGAGPSVLLVVRGDADLPAARAAAGQALAAAGLAAELVAAGMSQRGPGQDWKPS